MPRQPDTVVFDIGNVLIRWDPRHLYRKLFADEASLTHFLTHVCPPEFNLDFDRGRPFEEGIAERIALFPEHADAIRAWDTRWQEMVPGPISGSVALLEALRSAGVPLYAITNFSAPKFAECRHRFPFLDTAFWDVVVSAHEGVLKPEPAIYEILFTRNDLDPARTVFIDDSPANVAGARAAGMTALHFTDPDRLRADLQALGFAV
ncbi:HAD family phosphatase [Stappia sp.]|uniref:HAD family hydrolase n=1 Tax=Stappia sp. TaxID=1870903 RepID=UPI0032D8EB78